MKKFLKVFIIVCLVVAAIVGTCFLFFKNLKEKENKTPPIAQLLLSESKSKFDANMAEMSTLVNSDGTDYRLDLIIKTSKNLDDIVFTLSTYSIEQNTQIDNRKIAEMYNQVQASLNLLEAMVVEYKIKSTSTYFDRHLGANDFYKQASFYLTNYAKFANLLNVSLSNVNKNVDVKFNMFEIYANVVINTFDETKDDNWLTMVKDRSNIDAINNLFRVTNSFVNDGAFSIKVSQFNDAYYNCNKINFAKNLNENINVVNTLNTQDKEKVATYYFKLLCNI